MMASASATPMTIKGTLIDSTIFHTSDQLMESIVDVLFQFRNPASQSQTSSLAFPVYVSIDAGRRRPEGSREPPPPIQPHGRSSVVRPRSFCRIHRTICQGGQAGARMLRCLRGKSLSPKASLPHRGRDPRSIMPGRRGGISPVTDDGDHRGCTRARPLAGTGPCDVVDRISDQRARRLATTRPTPATASRPTSAMATPVFAPVLASLLPSVLLPPAGCGCSGVGWDCSAVGCGCSGVGWDCSGVGWGSSGAGSSGKSHVEDCEVSDSTMAAPLVVVPRSSRAE